MNKQPTSAELAAMSAEEFAAFIRATNIKTLSSPDVMVYLDGKKLGDMTERKLHEKDARP